MKKHRRSLLFILMMLMMISAVPAAVQASEEGQVSEEEQASEAEQVSEEESISEEEISETGRDTEEEQASETEQISEEEQVSEEDQVSETESTAEAEQAPETEEVSVTEAEQEQTDVPAAYSVQVTASLSGESVVITICDSTAAVDCLMVTLPGGETQVLHAIDAGKIQYSLTVDKSLQGETVSYIPGTAGETEITWYSTLGGNFAIPQLETASDTAGEDIIAKTGTRKTKTVKKTGTETASQSGDVSESGETSSESGETSSELDETSSETDKTSSGSGKTSSGSGKSSGTGKKKSSSGSKGKSGNTETEKSETVTEAKSVLGRFLLDSGRTLVYSPDEAPELEGMTYEATWEEEDGIRIYLYEEGGAILELSQNETEENSANDPNTAALRFLLIPEGEDSDSASRLWQQVLDECHAFL